MTEEQIKQQIFIQIGKLFDNQLKVFSATPAREAVQRAAEMIYGILETHKIQPDASAMQFSYAEARHIPAEAKLRWTEFEFPTLQVEEVIDDPKYGRQRGDTHFAPEVTEWLNSNAPGWTVDWDRGDWGEGTLVIHLSVHTQEQARAFMGKWGIKPPAA